MTNESFKRFFVTLAKYMINNQVDIYFHDDGSITLVDCNRNCKRTYLKRDISNNMLEVLNEIEGYSKWK